MVYKFLDKKTRSGVIATSKAGKNVNEQLAEELYKPITKKLKKRKVYARLKDNISAAEMGSLPSKNKHDKYFLCVICVIDVFTNMHGLNL